MTYFLHRLSDLVDCYDALTWRRHYKNFSTSDSMGIPGLDAWPEEYYQSSEWKEISEEEAMKLIVMWRMST